MLEWILFHVYVVKDVGGMTCSKPQWTSAFFFISPSFPSSSFVDRRRLLLPQAWRLLKVDSSSWWVTNAGAETWPCAGEEGRTKYTSFLKVKSCESHTDGNSTGTQTWLLASLFIIYIISSKKKTAEKNEKRKFTDPTAATLHINLHLHFQTGGDGNYCIPEGCKPHKH